MKKIKRLLIMTIGVFALVPALFGIKANAAVPSGSINVKIYTYNQEGWNQWKKWSQWNTDYAKYDTEYQSWIADGEDAATAKEEACTFWGRTKKCPATLDSTKSCKDYYGEADPTKIVVPNRSTFTTTEFTADDTIYFEFVVTGSYNLSTIELGAVPSLIEANGVALTDSSVGTPIAGDLGYMADTQFAKSTGGTLGSVQYSTVGGSDTQQKDPMALSVTAPYIERSAGAIGYQISANAKGNYTIDLASHDSVYFSVNLGRDKATYRANKSCFNVDKPTITVGNGSTNTTTTITAQTAAGVDDTDPSHYSTDSPITMTGFSTPVNQLGYNAVSSTATDVKFKATVAGGGTVTNVWYSNQKNGLNNKGGTNISPVGGVYSVPFAVSPTKTSTMYAMIEATPQDTAADKGYYLVTFQRLKLDYKQLDNIVFVDKATNPTAVTLRNAGNTADVNFSPTTQNYTLLVSQGVTSLGVTPTFDTTKGQTCQISGVTGTTNNGNQAITSATPSSIQVTMTAEDATQKIYTFSIVRLSDDNAISSVWVKDANNQTYQLTLNSATKTYETSSPLPYNNGNQTFTVMIQVSAGATITLNGTTYTSGNYGNTTYNFTPATKLATSCTINNLIVTSASGKAGDTYKIVVDRDGASSNTGVSSIKVNYNNADVTPSPVNDVYNANVSYVANVNNFSFTATVGESGQTLSYSTDGGSTFSALTSGSAKSINFATPYTAAQNVTVIVRVTAGNGVATKDYTINVIRPAARTNNLIGGITVNYNNADVTPSPVNDVYNANVSYVANVNNFSFTATVGESGQTLSYSTDGGNTFSALTSGSAKLVNFTTPYIAAQNVTVVVRVTAEDGTSTKDYTINVVRPAADDTCAVTLVVLDDSSGNVNYTTQTTGSNPSLLTTIYNLDILPYAVKKIKLQFTLAPSAPATTKLYYGATELTKNASGVYEYEYTISSTVGNTTGTPLYFAVGTEAYPRTGSSGGHPHTVYVKREVPDNQNTLDTSSIIVRDLNGHTHFPKSTSSNGLERTYEFVQSVDGNKFTIEAQLGGTDSKAKIYASTDSRSSVYLTQPYNPSDQWTAGTPVYLFVVPEIGATTTYRFEVILGREKETLNGLLDLKIKDATTATTTDLTGFTFNQSQSTYTIQVPYSVKKVLFEGSKEGAYSTWAQYPGNGTSAQTLPAAGGTQVYHVQVKSESNVLGTDYVITIVRAAAKTEKLIQTLTINGINVFDPGTGYNSYTNKIAWAMPRLTSAATMSYTISDGATISITSSASGEAPGHNLTYTSNNLQPGVVRTITFQVYSELDIVDSTGSYNEYKLYLVPADQGYQVSDIKYYKDQYNATTNPFPDEITDASGNTFAFNPAATSVQKYTVPYSVQNVDVHVILDSSAVPNSMNANITGDGYRSIPAPSTPLTYRVIIKSEYQKALESVDPTLAASIGQTKTYDLQFVRTPASNNNYLKEWKVEIGGTDYASGVLAADKSGDTIVKCENLPAGALTVNVTAVPEDDLADLDPGSKVGSFSLSLGNNTQTYTITVKAEDGTPRVYTYMISTGTIAFDDNNDIINIEVFPHAQGSNLLSGFNPTEDGPYEINVSSMVTAVDIKITTLAPQAKVTVNGQQTVDNGSTTKKYENQPVSEAGNPNEFRILCTSNNGTASTVTYIVKVTVTKADNDTSLSKFMVDNQNVVDGDVLTLPKGTTSTTVVAEHSGKGQVQPYDANPTLNKGENKIEVVVIAEDGTTKTHSVTVWVDGEETLDELHVFDFKDTNHDTDLIQNFSTTVSTYNITVPYTTDKVVLTAKATETDANLYTITGDGDFALNEGLNTREVVVTTKHGNIKKYTVNITREAGQSGNYILEYLAENEKQPASFSSNASKFIYVLTRSEAFGKVFDINHNVVKVSEGARFELETPTTNFVTGGYKEFVVKVTSQTGDVRKYTIGVYVANTNTDVSIDLLTEENGTALKDKDDNPYAYTANSANDTFNVNYYTNPQNKLCEGYLKATLTDPFAKVYVNGALFSGALQKFAVGDNVYNIEVRSEYAELIFRDTGTAPADYIYKYKLTVNRAEPDKNADLFNLKVMANGTDLLTGDNVFSPTKYTYFIKNIGTGLKSVDIQAEATKPTYATGDLGPQTLDNFQIGGLDGYLNTFKVQAHAEDGTVHEYTIHMARGNLDLEDLKNDNSISYIVVEDTKGNTYVTKESFKEDQLEYIVDLPASADGYYIRVFKPDLSVSKTYIDGTEAPTSSARFDIPSDFESKDHVVYQQSSTGVDGTKYKIKVNFAKPSDDNKLLEIKIDGAAISGFDPENEGPYDVGPFPNTKESVEIEATASDSNAEILAGTGTKMLTAGPNTAVITVKAENGDIKTYTINIKKSYPLPYLTDINVVGEKLLDTNNIATTFDKDTFTYKVIVPYTTINATIEASVDDANINDTVSCSNSTVQVNTGLKRTFLATNLPEGATTLFTFTVTSPQGEVVEYKLEIRRRSEASTNTDVQRIWIDEIPAFETDYKDDIREYEYTVPNKVKNLTIHVNPVKQPDNEGNLGATWESVNESNLSVGENKVAILIYAEDNISTRAIIVKVTREKMSYTVNTEAYKDFTTTRESDNLYRIDLGDKYADAIEDYTKYIVTEDDLEITVINDPKDHNCSEIILRIFDGSEEEFVTLKLNSTSLGGGASIPAILKTIMPWILLAIAIIILILILICVNKDKYGSINKRRKNQED